MRYAVIESPGARRLREQGEAEVARKCGSEEKVAKEQEQVRQKLVTAVEAERAKLLGSAHPQL